MTMDEINSLTEAIAQHEAQLAQIRLAICASSPGSDRDDLISLQSDIEELIKLTRENLSGIQNQQQAATSSDNFKAVEEEDPLAKEYALFKAELANEDAFPSSSNCEISESQSKEMTNFVDIEDDLAALQGMKCQAPYSHQWGHTTYHNALVFNVESFQTVSSMDQIQVRVMFTNPTHQEMLPCPYYLEGECRFTDEKCRFSHGELVHLSSLKEYKEPDFSVVQSGARVLVKHKDNLWYGAVVLSVHGSSRCEIKFESSGKKLHVDLHDILPLENSETTLEDYSGDESSDKSEDDTNIRENAYSLAVEQSLMNTPPTTALGDWEKHTKGIGSRLMAQMGYVTGTGLGKFGEGRIEPVEAVVLPAGKSLDHCMELRENAGGDENFFKVEKRLKRLKKKQELLNKRAYEREKQTTNVFDFLNNKLAVKRGNSGQLHHVAKVAKEKPASDGLKCESSRNLNIVDLQVGEEIKRAERDMIRLQESLSRHTTGSQTHTQLINKMQSKRSELEHLKASEHAINQERNQRKDKKKLVIF